MRSSIVDGHLLDGTGCQSVVCEEPGFECKPTCIIEESDGSFEVVECECLDPALGCYLDLSGPEPRCVGPDCMEIRTPIRGSDKELVCCVPCEPQPDCGPDFSGLVCLYTPCPDPDEQCLPILVFTDATGVSNVADCECIDPDSCHVDLDTDGNPICVGTCPEGMICDRVENPEGGGIEVSCECVPDNTPMCDPDPTGLLCQFVPCPDPTEKCSPVAVFIDGVTGIATISDCDCIQPDACHVDLNPVGCTVAFGPPTGVFCDGECPEDERCEEVQTDIPGTADFELCCVCEPIVAGFRRGDADNNGQANVADAIVMLLVNVLGQGELTCEDAADVDDSGSLTIADAIVLLFEVVLGTPGIAEPGQFQCGVDPTTDDRLGCESYTAPCD